MDVLKEAPDPAEAALAVLGGDGEFTCFNSVSRIPSLLPPLPPRQWRLIDGREPGSHLCAPLSLELRALARWRQSHVNVCDNQVAQEARRSMQIAGGRVRGLRCGRGAWYLK